MPTVEAVSSAPMAAAPMRYRADGAVDWGNMWDSFCALAQAGGPTHRGSKLCAAEEADPKSPAYRFAIAEVTRGILGVSGLRATSASTGWLAVACSSSAMAGWLAAAIEAEYVQSRAEGTTLFVPVGSWSDVTKEIKSVVTVVAKTTHYWLEHLPVQGPSAGGRSNRHVQRVHTEDVVLDIGQDMGSLVIYAPAELCGKEIELVRKDDETRRTHVDVAERRFNGRTIFAAVYPPVAAGVYAIWVDYTTPAGEVTIAGGEVAQLDWRCSSPRR